MPECAPVYMISLAPCDGRHPRDHDAAFRVICLMPRLALCALVLVAVAGCRDVPTQLLRSPLPTMDCPADIGMGPMANGKFLRDSTKSRYVTFIIDGKVARWNYNASRGGPLEIPGYPRTSEVKSVRMLAESMSFTEISRKYGTCFGVNVQVVETKSGNWAPAAAQVTTSAR